MVLAVEMEPVKGDPFISTFPLHCDLNIEKKQVWDRKKGLMS